MKKLQWMPSRTAQNSGLMTEHPGLLVDEPGWVLEIGCPGDPGLVGSLIWNLHHEMRSTSDSKYLWKLRNVPPSLFPFPVKISDESFITSVCTCTKVVSVDFTLLAKLFPPTLSLKSNVYLLTPAYFGCILLLTLPFLECGGGGRPES